MYVCAYAYTRAHVQVENFCMEKHEHIQKTITGKILCLLQAHDY